MVQLFSRVQTKGPLFLLLDAPTPFFYTPLEKSRLQENLRNRSQVQGSTFRVKDKEVSEDPKSPVKMPIFQVIANSAPNYGLGLTKMTLFS